MLHAAGPIRYRLASILAAHFDEFVAQTRQWIRPVIFETVRKILSCQTPALGCHLYRCGRCGSTRVVPHSCKSRFCPRCGKHATNRWAEVVLNELLNVPYHHLVFSIPWQLRLVIAFNRQEGLNRVVRAACGCLNQWAREQKGMRMGMLAVIHTFGADLKWHPHIHLLVTEGGLSLDGTRWVRPYKLGWLILHSGLKKMWKYHCLTGFRRAHKAGKFRWPARCAFLKNYPCFNSMLSKLWKRTWYVHIGACLLSPGATVRYLGRYTKRAVLAEYRITFYDGEIVRFRFKDYANGGKTSYKTLRVFAFLRRLFQHIPDKHFKMVRYAGLFATRWKKRYLDQARRALAQQHSPTSQTTEPARATLPWRERQRAWKGEDPLICRVCQTPMRLIGKIFGNHEKIAEHFEAAGMPTRPDGLGWQPKPG